MVPDNKINPRKCCSHRSHLTGMTLLELMVVLAIAGILGALAAPSFFGFIESSKVLSARDSLANALKAARSDAVYNKRSVTICASDDQSSCRASTDWSDGWIVFADLDGSGTRDAGEELVEVSYGEPDITVSGQAIFTFSTTGLRLDGGGAQTMNVSSAISGVEAACALVSSTGSLSYASGTDCP